MSAPKIKKRTRARGDEDKGKRREMILDAAEKVMAKRGLTGTNFGAIAKQSRLSRSLIYVYFPKHLDLIEAVCERGLLALRARFMDAIGRHEQGIEQIVAMAREYYAFSKAEPLYFLVIAEHETSVMHPPGQKDTDRKSSDCGKEVLGLVAGAVKKGIEDGSIRPDCGDPMLSAVSIWAFSHGLIQISTAREAMLNDELGVSVADVTEQGFRLLRQTLARQNGR